MPTTSSSEAAVKISGVSLLAIQRSTGRSSRRPPSTMAPITATIFSASSACPLGVRPASVSCAAPSSGSSARIGMAATSCSSSTAKPAWPLRVGRRLRSARVCSAIAVDESDSPSAATSATCQEAPSSQVGTAIAALHSSSCALPQPKIGRRSAYRRLGSSSRPTRNSISTTPNSAKCRMSCTLDTSPRPQGPMAMPATK